MAIHVKIKTKAESLLERSTRIADTYFDKANKHPLVILSIALVLVLLLLALAVTKIYESSEAWFVALFLLILNFTMFAMQRSLRRGINEILKEDKLLFICFLIISIAVSIISSAALLSDFNFSPNGFQQTIIVSMSVLGAINIANEVNYRNRKILDKRYFTYF